MIAPAALGSAADGTRVWLQSLKVELNKSLAQRNKSPDEGKSMKKVSRKLIFAVIRWPCNSKRGARMSIFAAADLTANRIDYWIRRHVIQYWCETHPSQHKLDRQPRRYDDEPTLAFAKRL
jgi:hypothetical protein